MPYPIKVSGRLEAIDGTDIQHIDWTCDALDVADLQRLRHFYALNRERASQLGAHSSVVIASDIREIWLFTPSGEAREAALWERLIRRLTTRAPLAEALALRSR